MHVCGFWRLALALCVLSRREKRLIPGFLSNVCALVVVSCEEIIMVCRVVLKSGLLLRCRLSYLARKVYVEVRIFNILPTITVTLLVNVMFVELCGVCVLCAMHSSALLNNRMTIRRLTQGYIRNHKHMKQAIYTKGSPREGRRS